MSHDNIIKIKMNDEISRQFNRRREDINLFIIRYVAPKLSFLHFLSNIVVCSLIHALICLHKGRGTFTYVYYEIQNIFIPALWIRVNPESFAILECLVHL